MTAMERQRRQPDESEIASLRWWTVRGAARRLGVSEDTVRRMHHDDPENFGRKFRGCIRIHDSQLARVENLKVDAKVKTAVRRQRYATAAVDEFPDL